MDISQLLSTIDATIDDIAKAGPGAVLEVDRQQLLAASKRLTAAAESPLDSVLSIVLGIHRASAFRTGVDMGLFNVLIAIKEEGITAAELAEKTNSDEIFITRLMRFLTSTGYAKELGIRYYAPTPKTGYYVTGSPLTDAIIHLASHSQILSQLPEYFSKKGDYKNPDDINNSPFQFAFGWEGKGTYFDWLASIPEQQEAFNRMMAITRIDRGEEWFDFYPTEERFGSTDPSKAVLVDVGGGLGHDLAAFHKRFPSISGKLILQDVPAVINDPNIKNLPKAIEPTIHDFFTDQPIKGAKSYYMRTVLHDFPDKQAVQILKGIRDAMTEESVLLLNENFLPEKGVPLYNAEVDFSMLAMFSSMERTERQWIELLEEAGLKLVKVWRPKKQLTASATLFEAARKD